MKITVDGTAQPNRDEQISLDVQTGVEVLAVAPNGKPTKLRLVITKAMAGQAAPSDQLLPPDAVVIIEKVNGQTTFTDATGAVYPKPVQQALNVVFSIGDGSTTDDQVFGTTQRQAVGATWPIAVDFAVQKLREDRMPVDPANCSGSVTFLGLVQDQGMECQQIAAVMQMQDVAFPLPPGMAITSSSVVMKLDGLFPSDITRPRTRQSMSMDADVQAAGAVGLPGQEKQVTFTMSMRRRAELTITQVAP